jgi:hypothetical protein
VRPPLLIVIIMGFAVPALAAWMIFG